MCSRKHRHTFAELSGSLADLDNGTKRGDDVEFGHRDVADADDHWQRDRTKKRAHGIELFYRMANKVMCKGMGWRISEPKSYLQTDSDAATRCESTAWSTRHGLY